jgi:hypothetical protein
VGVPVKLTIVAAPWRNPDWGWHLTDRNAGLEGKSADRTDVKATRTVRWHWLGIRIGSWGVIAVGYVALVLRHPWHPLDYNQQSAAIVALIHGHLSAVYPAHNGMTSPPGFLMLAAPIVALTGGDPTGRVTGPCLAVLSAVFLAAAALRLSWTIHPGPTPVRDRILVGALLLGSPFTDGLIHAYHPEDLMALGLVLVAVDGALRRHLLIVGLALGGAILTRQWALLAVGPILVYLGADWRRVAGTMCVPIGLVLLPFAVLEWTGLIRALSANNGLEVGYYSIWQYVTVDQSVAYALARAAPLLFAGVTTVILRLAWARSRPSWRVLLGALILCLGYRLIFDTDSLVYYMAPTLCLLIFVGLYGDDRVRWRAMVIGLVFETLASLELYLPHLPVSSPRTMVMRGALELAFFAACATGGHLVALVDDPPSTPPRRQKEASQMVTPTTTSARAASGR